MNYVYMYLAMLCLVNSVFCAVTLDKKRGEYIQELERQRAAERATSLQKITGQLEAEARERQRLRERYFTLFGNQDFIQAQQLLKRAQLGFVQKKVDFVATIELAARALKLFHSAYQAVEQKFPQEPFLIELADTSNMVSAVYKMISNVGLSQLALLIQNMQQKSVQQRSYETDETTFLTQLAYLDRICIADDGLYTYFNIPSSKAAEYQQKARTYYMQQRNAVVFNFYSTLLDALIYGTQRPTEDTGLNDRYYAERLTRAQEFLKQAEQVWTQKLEVPGYSSAREALYAAKNVVGTLYAYRAQYALISMRTVESAEQKEIIEQNKQQAGTARDMFMQAAKLYEGMQDDTLYKPLFVRYEQLTRSLTLGMQVLDTAEHTERLSDKFHAYEQARDALLGGGAHKLAQYAATQALRLAASVYVQEGKQALATVSLAPLHEPKPSIDVLLKTFSTLVRRASAAREAYQKAIAVLEQSPALESMQQKIVLQDVINFLTNLINASVVCGTALTELQKNKEKREIVQRTHEQNEQALEILRRAEPAYQGSWATYLPFYVNSTTNALWQALQKQIAYIYLQYAHEVPEELAYQYYMYAYSLRSVISPEELQTIQAHIEKGDIEQRVKQSFAAAQQATEWQSARQDFYTSSANLLWKQALDIAWLFFVLSYAKEKKDDAKSLLLKVIQTYVQNYTAHVPAEFYPELGAALLTYQVYLVAMLTDDQALQTEQLLALKPLMQAFFAQGQQRAQRVQQLATASEFDVKNLTAWIRVFEAAVRTQQALIYEVKQLGATQKISELLQIMQQKEGSVHYVAPLTGDTIVLGNLRLELARAYQQQAEQEKVAGRLTEALKKYQEAAVLYAELGMFEQKIILDRTIESMRYLVAAAAMEQNVIPLGISTAFLPSLSVPMRYALRSFTEQIPFGQVPAELMPLIQRMHGTSLEEQKKIFEEQPKTPALQTQLIELAQIASLYTALKVNNLLPTISIANLLKTGSSDALVQRYIQDVQFEGKQRELLMTKGMRIDATAILSKIILLAPSPQLVNVVTEYQLIAAIPEIVQGKIWKPTALTYYSQAAEWYAKGGDTEKAKIVQRSAALCFVAHAYALQQKINYMRGSEQDIQPYISDSEEWHLLQKTRVTLGKNRKIVQLSQDQELLEALQIVANYYAAMTSDIQSVPFAPFSPVEQNNIHERAGRSYEELGDFLAGYVQGDPFDAAFKALLAQASSSYLLAQGAYSVAGKQAALVTTGAKITALFERVGDSLVTGAHYLNSLSYYRAAQKAYENLTAVDKDTVIDRLQQKIVRAQFTGATERCAYFREKRFGQTIELPGGTHLDFASLMKLHADSKSLQCLTGALGGIGIQCPANAQALDTAYHTISQALLDALIFYSAIAYAIQQEGGGISYESVQPLIIAFVKRQPRIATFLADEQKRTAEKKLSDEQQKKPDESEQKQDLLPDTHERTILTRVVLDDATFEKLSAQELKKLCFDGFEEFSRLPDRSQRNTAISAWSSQLFAAFSARYMHDYFGGQQPQEQFSNFIAALKAHKNELFAPAEQYMGSLQG